MQTRSERPDARSDAVGRAIVYGSLSKLLLPPDAETSAAIRSGRIGDELEAALSILPGAPRARAERIGRLARDMLEPEAAYFRVFDHALVKAAPPFETEHSGSEPFLRTNDLGDVSGFYAAWGLSARGVRERPDHIGIEAEFMSFLCQKEAIAHGEDGPVDLCTHAADRFLVEHLGGFAPFYAERLAKVVPDDLYVEAARLLAEVVTWDMERRGIVAEERHRSCPVQLGVAGGEA